MIFNTPFIFGLSVPWLPAFAPGNLLIVTWLFVLLNLKGFKFNLLSYFLPFLFVLATWTAVYLALSLGVDGLEILWKWSGINGIYHWLTQPSALFSISLVSLLRYSAFFILLTILIIHPEKTKQLKSGLIYGVILSSLISALELSTVTNIASLQESSFWSGVNRYSGTFTDPNSMGIFLALILPLLIQKVLELNNRGKLFGMIFIFAVIVLGLFSGSRSFLLALFLYLIIFLYFSSKRITILVLTFLTAILIGFYTWYNIAPESFVQLVQILPTALSRVVNTFISNHINDSFYSRFIFNRIGFDMFSDAPLFGVGFENFRFLVSEQGQSLGITLGNWVDNSNNFYLGILAELGILGFVALIYPFLKMRYDFSDKYATAQFIVLLILLLFGPHLNFDEVVVISGVIFASVITKVKTPLKSTLQVRKFILMPTILYVAIIIFLPRSAQHREYGVFTVEGSDSESPYKWSSVAARKWYSCEDNSAVISFRTINPRVLTQKSIVTFEIVEGYADYIEIDDHERHQISYKCPDGEEKVLVKISISPPWIPAQTEGFGEDQRVLGVQLFE